MTALLRGCLWKGDKSKSQNLDSRWGDTSISAPTLGGWSQPASECPSGSEHKPGYGSDCERDPFVKRLDSAKSTFPRISRQGRSRSTSKMDTESTGSDKPVFIYKPASEAFLRDMAALGNRRPDPELLPSEYNYSSPSYNPRLIVYRDEGDDLVKELSEAIRNTTPLGHPQELRDMPHHPSYRSSISSHSSSIRSTSSVRSVASRARRNAIRPASPTQPLPASPRLSPHPEFSPVDYGEPTLRNGSSSNPFRVPDWRVDQPVAIQAGKRSQRHKRKVTEVMVPSSADIFG